jgi:hypothetical protein
MPPTNPGNGQRVNDGQRINGQDRARTVAVMRSTVGQLRLAAQHFYTSAAASPSLETATRLQTMGEAVSVQADDIQQRIHRLTDTTPGGPSATDNGQIAT